jgi:hypothetical protein
MGINECAICGSTSKSFRFWLCKECSVMWGCYNTQYKHWPDWVKEMIKMHRSINKHEEELILEPDHINMLIESGKTRP